MIEFLESFQWVIVPLLAGFLALLGSWKGAKWGKTTEHEQWLRNERLRVYTRFLEEDVPLDVARMTSWIGEGKAPPVGDRGLQLITKILLIGGASTSEQARKVLDHHRALEAYAFEAVSKRIPMEEMRPKTEKLASETMAATGELILRIRAELKVSDD
ncbi:hypothetical protein [Zhihengliuella halotolerans]|uniref:hypothetical protein n=1 Tax=Zhihengliuella halotolerans TaxID=370736 RepID=UPI00102BFAD2|nr:hypothetical protein [Zhihengliuella halotolerans]